MLSIGNELCNSIWEMNVRGRHKPMPQSTREEKEAWVRSKYVHREFLPVLPPANMALSEVRILVLYLDLLLNFVYITCRDCWNVLSVKMDRTWRNYCCC